MRVSYGVVLALLIALAPQMVAAQARVIGEHRQWITFEFDEEGNRVCYMASRPVKEEGNYTRRGDVYALVTHRPALGSFGVVSFVAGYTFRENEPVTVVIDGDQRFTLFSVDDNAWAEDADDPRLVDAMKAGVELVVQGTSSRGTLTTDTYSLLGFTAAFNEISRSCPQ